MIKKIREAGHVSRYHTVRTIRNQTVGEHSWGVAQILLTVHPTARAELIKAALNHDLGELMTGDIPAPFKWNNRTVDDASKVAEGAFLQELSREYHLTKEETALIKFCDMMELIMWCLEEISMGNQYAAAPCANGINYLVDRGLWVNEVGEKLLLDAINEYNGNLPIRPPLIRGMPQGNPPASFKAPDLGRQNEVGDMPIADCEHHWYLEDRVYVRNQDNPERNTYKCRKCGSRKTIDQPG